MTSQCDNFLYKCYSEELNAQLSYYKNCEPDSSGIFNMSVFITIYTHDGLEVAYEDNMQLKLPYSDLLKLVESNSPYLLATLEECYLAALQARKNLPSLHEDIPNEQ